MSVSTNVQSQLANIRGTYLATREQLAGQLQGLEVRATELERRTLSTLETRVQIAWHVMLERVRVLLKLAPREELESLTARVADLEAQIEQLLSGDRTDKIRELAEARAVKERAVVESSKKSIGDKSPAKKPEPKAAPTKSSIKAKSTEAKSAAPKKVSAPSKPTSKKK